MDPKNRRKPIPAGGQPTPATIEVANATPAATDNTTNEGGTGGEPIGDAGSTNQVSHSAEQGNVTADVADQASNVTSTSDISAEQAAPAAEPQKPTEPEIVDARVLVAFDEHEADDIVSAPSNVIEQLKLAGRVDPHPDAVAFARELHE